MSAQDEDDFFAEIHQSFVRIAQAMQAGGWEGADDHLRWVEQRGCFLTGPPNTDLVEFS